MKVKRMCVLFALASLTCQAATLPLNERVIRFGFFVGRQEGGAGRAMLKYPVSDAQALAGVMEELGGLRAENQMLLENPSKTDWVESFAKLRARIDAAQQPGRRKELFFYYSGHSDDRGFQLGRETLSYSEFKKMLAAAHADLTVVILDSCESGVFTQLKGGRKHPAFIENSLSKLKGNVVLTSSSAEEAAQESDRILGSYFTHYLVSALRGAADGGGGHKITLNEAYQYAYERTLASTQDTLHGAQHPSYSIQINGSGELVMTDLRDATSALVFPAEAMGQFFVRDASGRTVAEIEKTRAQPVKVVLASGHYTVLWSRPGHMSRAEVAITSYGVSELALSRFVDTPVVATVARGGESDELVPVQVSVIPSLSSASSDPRLTENHFAFNLAYGTSGLLTGGSLAIGGTRVIESAQGAQVAGIFNQVSGTIIGLQVAGGYNYARSVVGTQIGVVNVARVVRGVQIGVFNSAMELRGVQLGLLNVADNSALLKVLPVLNIGF